MQSSSHGVSHAAAAQDALAVGPARADFTGIPAGPDSPLEREADVIAARALETPTNRQSSTIVAVQRKPAEDSGGGMPLSASMRSFFEPRLGHDLQHVRLHTDSHAQRAADSLNANAFTSGNHIYFGANMLDTHSSEGSQLMAHELAHVLQYQNATPTSQATGAMPAALRQEKGTKKPAAKKQRTKHQRAKKGKVAYGVNKAFIADKLSGPNVAKARSLMLGTKIGQGVVNWLENNGVTVTVVFVAHKEDIPGKPDGVGYFDEVSPKVFNVYVTAGYEGGSFVRQKSGSDAWVSKTVDRDADDIASTLFHELLHCWFVTRHPNRGTGHTHKVEPPTVHLDGSKTYDEDQYEAEFLFNLKRFDHQMGELLKKQKQP